MLTSYADYAVDPQTSCNSPLITSVVITAAFEWRKNTSFSENRKFVFSLQSAVLPFYTAGALFLLCRAKFVGKFLVAENNDDPRRRSSVGGADATLTKRC